MKASGDSIRPPPDEMQQSGRRATYVCATSAGFLVIFLLQALMTEHSYSFTFFVWIWIFFQSAYSLGAACAPHLQYRLALGQYWWLLITSFVMSFLSYAFGGNIAWLLGSLLLGVFRGLFQPIVTSQLNHLLLDNNRATINSIMQMALRVSNMLLGPILGWVADHNGAQSGLLILTGFSVPIAVLLWVWQNRLGSSKSLDNLNPVQVEHGI